MSVFVTLIVSAGVFTLVDFYFHFAGLQPEFEEAQQQAAAAGGHYASEAQATPRVVRWVTPLRRQASISASGYHVCLFNCIFSKACGRCGTGSTRVQVTGPGRAPSCHCLQLWL